LRIIEELFAQGHPNVVARHPTTFEITKDTELTKRGDCIIAVGATKGPADFSIQFKSLCRNDEATIFVELQAARIDELIEGRGSCRLKLSHRTEIVGRKSTHISDRTIMIRADRAACDIDRDLVDALKSTGTRLQVRIIAEL
jgi:hypothetical protein